MIGRSRRPRPTRLASKLLQIRLGFDLTQQQMLERLDYRQSSLLPPHISDYELDKRDPPLPLVLAYARTAGVPLETLADDNLDLPDAFAGPARLTRLKRGRPSRRCPHCAAGGEQIKAGRNRSGSKRYRCRRCQRHYTLRPASKGHRDERAGPMGPEASLQTS
jgi:transcriptional regulator with XRE-family HTH domain